MALLRECLRSVRALRGEDGPPPLLPVRGVQRSAFASGSAADGTDARTSPQGRAEPGAAERRRGRSTAIIEFPERAVRTIVPRGRMK